MGGAQFEYTVDILFPLTPKWDCIIQPTPLYTSTEHDREQKVNILLWWWSSKSNFDIQSIQQNKEQVIENVQKCGWKTQLIFKISLVCGVKQYKYWLLS